jgi:CHAT domain
MPINEKLLVRQLAGDFLREESPIHLAELDRDFEDLYGRAGVQLAQVGQESANGDWSLPFDATFGAGMFLGTLVGLASLLVREAVAVGEHRRERKMRELGPKLAKQTGNPELVLALCAQVVDLVARLERMPAHAPVQPDLELQVHLTSTPGGTSLTYVLHSTVAGFHFETIPGPALKKAPEAFAASLFEQLERLQRGCDVEGDSLTLEEAESELAGLGQSLYRELFPGEMRKAYRRFRDVRTVQITSDEPAIPWELIKPYDDEQEEILDDDFFCLRFQLTRWRHGRTPVSAFPVRKLACIGSDELPKAAQEREVLTGLAARHQGVENASPRSALRRDVEKLLEKGGCDLLHFVGHGEFDPGQVNESKIVLKDQPLRVRHLTGAVQTRLKKDRPLIFLNACRVGRQAWSLTGLGGWVEAWVRTCGCGAFLGPQWAVGDSQAYEFARVFYGELERGGTLGEAALEARREVHRNHPARTTWLAYAVYGHPNARASFGNESAESLPPPIPPG